ncbi:phospholipase D-like domain-containing protein, partial [Limnoraphis robusta]
TNCQKQISTIKQLFKADFYKKIYKLSPNNNILIAPDNMRNNVEHLINSAQHSINMLFPLITNDSRIFAVLRNRIKAGVTISAICSPNIFSLDGSTTLDVNYFIELVQIGVRLKFSYNPPIHCRVIVIDSQCSNNKKAYIGSGHLKTHCLDFNREIAVITSQPEVITQIANLFETLWAESEVPFLEH